MKFTIINIANKMPQWVDSACEDYLKRINRGQYSCNIIEIKHNKANKSSDENKQLEATKFASVIPPSSYVIMLDEKGIDYTSQSFAAKIDKIKFTHNHICLIIGGSDGLDNQFKKSANSLIKLSSLTFPHALVRVVLLEQIYRALSILENHPYHKE